MAKIEFNHYDLYVETITNREGDKVEVAKISNRLAFDRDFIEELKAQGVKKIVKYNNQEEEIEENDEE